MWLRVACCALVLGSAAAAQTARVSGRVVEDGRGTPVSGASVRITGSDPSVTDSLGRFQFTGVVPGRHIVTVSSIGFRLRTIEISVSRDTSLEVAMVRRIVSLDTMVVRPRFLRVQGTAVDSVSGDYLLQAQATIYPGSRFVGALNGKFTFDSVPPGLATIVVEAFERLPVRVELDVTRDTSFRVKMAVDSVTLRMIAMQVKRLELRARSTPYQMRSYNRSLIEEHGYMSMGEFLIQKGVLARELRPPTGPTSGCYFIDDIKVDRMRLQAQLPELIERVETYRKGAMIRVYTRRYVASLIGKSGLQNVTYIPTGMAPSCY